MGNKISIGLARIHAEPGERRDFLPGFVAKLVKIGYQVYLEHGYGTGIGLCEDDYLQIAPLVRFVAWEVVYQQDYVLVLRYPGDDVIRQMRPGTCLISMLHYATRPKRVALMHSQGLEAISLNSLTDDTGRRLVENLQAVAWNGIRVAFEVLSKVYPYPGLESPQRSPLNVTLLGAGAVGSHAIQAAIRYGDEAIRQQLASQGVPGVRVTVVDYDLTPNASIMEEILSHTDLLIDATQRWDTSRPVIPNEWIGVMPTHAVLLDLSVDPYDVYTSPPSTKGIEGIPQGDLDQYIFSPDDPAYDAIPAGVNTTNRRYVVSCYSWPGVRPKECMEVYRHQLKPIMRTLFESGGTKGINSQGKFFQRAISRAMLSRWQVKSAGKNPHPSQ